jgi:3-keto-L-gulonate-6-phosphate decarboxylase
MGFDFEAQKLAKEMLLEIETLNKLAGKRYGWQKKDPFYVKYHRVIDAEIAAIRGDIEKINKMLARHHKFDRTLDKANTWRRREKSP